MRAGDGGLTHAGGAHQGQGLPGLTVNEMFLRTGDAVDTSETDIAKLPPRPWPSANEQGWEFPDFRLGLEDLHHPFGAAQGLLQAFVNLAQGHRDGLVEDIQVEQKRPPGSCMGK